MDVNWVQVGVELLVIAAGFIVLYWKQRVEAEHRLTKVETLVSELKEDHKTLGSKVEGISRHLAELTGIVKRNGKDT